jgi:hypothetical protein
MLFSCKAKKEQKNSWQIELPETKIPENLNQWAICKYPYIRLRQDPREKSKIIYYLPIGALIKILQVDNELTTFANEDNYWYYIDYEGEKGWIFGSFIEIFTNYDEALNKSEEIILGDKK